MEMNSRKRSVPSEHCTEQAVEPQSKRKAVSYAIEPTPTYESSWANVWHTIFSSNDDPQNAHEMPECSAMNKHSQTREVGASSPFSEPYSHFAAAGTRIQEWAEATIPPLTHENDEGMTMDINSSCPETDQIRCFGMIHDIDARLLGDMAYLRLELLDQQADFVPLTVSLHPHMVSLVLENGTELCQTADAMLEPLRNAYKIQSVFLEGFTGRTSCLRCVERARRLHDARIKVDINVYGQAEQREQVGRYFSACGIHLQNLRNSHTRYKYDNPHMITFRNCSLGAAASDGNAKQVHISSDSSIEVAFKAVSESETRDRHLSGVNCDSRVAVPLLEHQKQALEFMIQKEQGISPSDFQLWRADTKDGVTGSRHTITDCWTSGRPQEIQSGILADDTGMGKTLSVLSLITKTLPDARNWCLCRPEDLVESNARDPRSGATVIVVPSILIMNGWQKEIKDHLDGSLMIEKYHGKHRHKAMGKIINADVVLTTYHTLAAERNNKKSLVNDIRWFRVVLDEAHTVKRQTTTLFAAVSKIDACHRWCLTATPIQNKLEDLGSLLAFIRADPFDRASMFGKHIVAPFVDDTHIAKKQLASICDFFCLRRTKDRLNLPPLRERRRTVVLSDEERTLYEQTFRSMARALSHGSREKCSGTPFGKFQIQLQLRIICNHGTFQRRVLDGHLDKQTQREDAISSVGKDEEVRCSSCEQPTPILATNLAMGQGLKTCPHILCEECQGQMSEVEGEISPSPNCPFCTISTQVSPDATDEREATSCGSAGYPFNAAGISSKVNALMQDVFEDRETSKRLVATALSPKLLRRANYHL